MESGRDAFAYIGDELELFAEATHWKQYLFEQLEPFLGEAVLEVGAGIGATTQALCRAPHRWWVCLEPDEAQAQAISRLVSTGQLPQFCEVRRGTVQSATLATFDSILYIDVLEHIEEDREELAAAARHLEPRGFLIVLAPAHPWLYSSFDAAVGHCRRYTKKRLVDVAPPQCDRVRLRYLDSMGALASAANRFALRQRLPTRSQIALWDNRLIPLSRWVDRCTGHAIGRTLLAVWRAR